MEKLYFQIQGSRLKPYKVTFEGAGASLIAACTCPAGKKAGIFCKHIAQLLKGDSSKIVEGINSLPELLERAQGSPLLERAKTHKAAPPKPEQIDLGDIKTLKDLANHVAKNLDQPNCWCEYSEEENETKSVTIYEQRYFKNGKPYKHPDELLKILYEPFHTILIFNEETEEYDESEPIQKVRPFSVNNSNFGKFSSAATKFLGQFERLFANEHDVDKK